MCGVKNRFPPTLLLAVLLLAVQTVVLVHEHEGSGVPASAAAQGCEFCVGHLSAAPAPEPGRTVQPDLDAERIPGPAGFADLPAEARAAHRSRAPPAFRSA